MEFTRRRTVEGEFDAVLDRTVAALEDEGFGVLCDVDVRETFREKLDEEFRRYRILGACNPELARRALGEEVELGALLPCNVVVYETDDGAVAVSAVVPSTLLSVVDEQALDPIAAEVETRFERVLDAVAGTHPA